MAAMGKIQVLKVLYLPAVAAAGVGAMLVKMAVLAEGVQLYCSLVV
jgi:hypothetical protein